MNLDVRLDGLHFNLRIVDAFLDLPGKVLVHFAAIFSLPVVVLIPKTLPYRAVELPFFVVLRAQVT